MMEGVKLPQPGFVKVGGQALSGSWCNVVSKIASRKYFSRAFKAFFQLELASPHLHDWIKLVTPRTLGTSRATVGMKYCE